ncbi:MAG: S8 family serine peptidase [Clostridiales bacterium]|jgi:subtilisin family serine protease|nr:S8 family serine peptidase [Clostridiales bacterium]
MKNKISAALIIIVMFLAQAPLITIAQGIVCVDDAQFGAELSRMLSENWGYWNTEENADFHASEAPQSTPSEFATRRLIVTTKNANFNFNELFPSQKIVIGLQSEMTVLQFDSETAAEQAFNKLLLHADVDYVQPDRIVTLVDDGFSNITGTTQADGSVQTGSDPTSWGISRIGSDEYTAALLDEHMDDNDVVIAVVDTGAWLSHSFYSGRLVTGYNVLLSTNNPVDDHGHGTHVTGIISDVTRKAPDRVKIMPIKALDSKGTGTDLAILSGIIWAVNHGADAINMSLGGRYENKAFMPTAGNSYISPAINAGIPVIAASGNDSGDVSYTVPAAYAYSITVANVDEKDKRHNQSNYGSAVDVAAPGSVIWSSYYDTNELGECYAKLTGTSMAAPHVAGAVALMMLTHEEYTASDYEYLVQSWVDDAGSTGKDNLYGYGILNMNKALNTEGKFNIASVRANDVSVQYGTMPTLSFRAVDSKTNDVTSTIDPQHQITYTVKNANGQDVSLSSNMPGGVYKIYTGYGVNSNYILRHEKNFDAVGTLTVVDSSATPMPPDQMATPTAAPTPTATSPSTSASPAPTSGTMPTTPVLPIVTAPVVTSFPIPTPAPTSGGGSGGGGGGGGSGTPSVTPTIKPSPTINPEPTSGTAIMRDIAGHWSENYIYEMVAKKIINGYLQADGTSLFRPDSYTTRAEFVKMLALMSMDEIDANTALIVYDVSAENWYASYVSWAISNSLVTGYENNTFRGDNFISRQEMAVILVRYADYKHLTLEQDGAADFNDSGSVAYWAKYAVNVLQNSGILTGDERGNFNPELSTRRSETVAMLYRIDNVIPLSTAEASHEIPTGLIGEKNPWQSLIDGWK